jgi:hypothetical protein
VQPFGKLTVIVNGVPETEYTLAKRTIALGRAADNDIVLADRLVSGHSISILCVFGYGVKTPTKVVFQTVSERWWEGEVRVEFDDGDGDVPTQSAVLRGAEIHPVRQHHGSLYIDQDVKGRLAHERPSPRP